MCLAEPHMHASLRAMRIAPQVKIPAFNTVDDTPLPEELEYVR